MRCVWMKIIAPEKIIPPHSTNEKSIPPAGDIGFMNGDAIDAINTQPITIAAGPIKFKYSLLGAHHPMVLIPPVIPAVYSAACATTSPYIATNGARKQPRKAE